MHMHLSTAFRIMLLLATVVLVAAADHPRLLFTAADIPALRAKITKEPWKSMAERLAKDRDTDDWGAAPGNPTDAYDRVSIGLRAAFLYVLHGDDAQAAIARKATEATIASKDWANGRLKGLSLYMQGSRVALMYDFCHGAPSWDAAFAGKVSAALKTHGDVIVSKGGSEQNTSAASNWQGSRYASGGLCLLATDETVDAKQIEQCYGRVERYLRSNLGDGAQSRGWNCEGLGYTYFPMGNYVCPFAEAMLRRDPAKDLRKACPAAGYALWSCAASLVLTRDGRRHPDFADDNPGANAEGCQGFAFRWCPPALQPGLVWTYDRTVGAAGDKTWDNARFGTIASILYHPGSAVVPADPITLPAWRAGFDDRGGNGMFTFRNAYGGEDICVQAFAKLLGGGGHAGPDALSFRILGIDGLWGTGGGRYGKKDGGVDVFVRSQNTLYPGDPNGPVTTNDDRGAVADCQVAEDGSGWLLMTAARNNVGTTGMRRLLATDWKRSGALAAVVVCDSSTNGRFWQMCSTADIPITVAGQTFTMQAARGTTLRGQVLYPAKAELRTGSRDRGSNAGTQTRNNWVTVATADGGCVVALTVVASGGKHPAATATGTWTGEAKGTVTVGGWTLAIDGKSVSAK
jgi:hypothetical protein